MDFEKYKSKLHILLNPTKPRLPAKHTAEELQKYAEELKVYEEELIKVKNANAEYQADSNKLQDQFKHDALEETGFLGHPLEKKAWNFAWEHGHANGYSEVFYWLCELTNMIIHG